LNGFKWILFFERRKSGSLSDRNNLESAVVYTRSSTGNELLFSAILPNPWSSAFLVWILFRSAINLRSSSFCRSSPMSAKNLIDWLDLCSSASNTLPIRTGSSSAKSLTVTAERSNVFSGMMDCSFS
jgi:hypothetical protein